MQGYVSGVFERHTFVFMDGIGMLEGTTATIYLESDHPAKFFKSSSLPYALERKVDEELGRLVYTTDTEPVRYSDGAP